MLPPLVKMSSVAFGGGNDPDGFPQYLAQCIKIDVVPVLGAAV